APSHIYTLSLHDALPIFSSGERRVYVAEKLRLRKAHRDRVHAAAADPVLVLRAKVERATIAASRSYTPGHFAGRVGLFLPSRVRSEERRVGKELRCGVGT